MKRLLLAVSLFGIAHVIAQAETMGTTAGWFKDYCAGQIQVKTTETGEEYSAWLSVEGSYCAGYLAAAIDSFEFTVIIPNKVPMLGRDIKSLHQLTWVYAVFAEYLSRHPEMLQGNPYFVIEAALRGQIVILQRKGLEK